MPQRWNADRLLSITGTPLTMTTVNFDSVENAVDPHRGPPGHREDGPDDEATSARRIPILQRDLTKHGYSPNCSRCSAHRLGQHVKAQSLSHSEACRARIYQLMRADKDPRIAAADNEGESAHAHVPTNSMNNLPLTLMPPNVTRTTPTRLLCHSHQASSTCHLPFLR